MESNQTLVINITDFLSLKKVDFCIKKGVSVIAGLNGSGKSQLLMGIWQNKPSNYNSLSNYGFRGDILREEIQQKVVLSGNAPSLILYRPAIRKLAEANRNNEYASVQPMSGIIDPEDGSGYGFNEDSRFVNIYSIVANCLFWGTSNSSTESQKFVWNTLVSKFEAVFEKRLCSSGGPSQGIKVGVQLPDGTVTSLNTLSTGELEFISLFLDLLLENENSGGEKRADMILIDELDAHFHPDLQKRIIESMQDLCSDIYVLLTTHSPSVMLSVDSERLFYLEKAEKCLGKNGIQLNQISSLAQNSEVFKKIVDMYGGFFSDAKVANLMRDTDKYIIQKFTDECLRDSDAIDGKAGKSSDPQISFLRGAITATPKPLSIIEIGCGKGRTLSMLKDFDDDTLKLISYVGADICEKNLSEIKEYAREIGISDRLSSFITTTSPYEKYKGDICVFANVLHEFGAENINNEMLKYLRCVNMNGSIYILEALRLSHGESDYIILYPDAMNALFKPSIESGAIKGYSCSIPSSFKDTPLMEASFTVADPSRVTLDVKAALEKTVEIDCKKLVSHKKKIGAPLTGMDYAFVVDNLANAIIGLKALSSIT